MKRTLPLSQRLPNPPLRLVGRDAEIAALTESIREANVTVVAGPGGIGKASTVVSTLHAAFATRVESIRCVRLGAEQPPEAVIRALTANEGVRSEDWTPIFRDPSGLAASALDLAESMEAWIVLQSTETTDFAALDVWLQVLIRHARRSRWIVLTRSPPAMADVLGGRVVDLGPLSATHLRALAAQLAPNVSEAWLEAALAAASGSPGWLRRALSLERPLEGDARALRARLRDDFLSLLGPAEKEVLAALVVAESPVPRGCVEGLEPVLEERMVAGGWLEVWPDGSVLVSALPRAHLAALTAVPTRRRAAANLASRLAVDVALLAPAHALECVRLWVEAGHARAAADALEVAGDRLLDAGYAKRLWSLLETFTDPAIERWRLRASVEANATQSTHTVLEPTSTAPEVQLDWARYLAARGELRRAEALARRVYAEVAESNPGLAADAQVHAARFAMTEGRYVDALAGLEALSAPVAVARALRLSCLAALGRPGVLVEARSLLAEVLAAPDGESVKSRLAVATLFYRIGHLTEAGQAFDALLHDEAAAPLALRRPDVSFVQFAVRMALGQLDQASAALARLLPALDTDSIFGLSTQVGHAAIRLARGTLEDLEVELERLRRLAIQQSRPDLEGFSASLAAELARLHGVRPVSVERPDSAFPSYYLALVHLQSARVRARCGVPFESEPALDHADCRVLGHVVDADVALAEGDVVRASTSARAALSLARAHGLGLREADALELLADAEHLRGAYLEASEAVQVLGAMGRAMPSVRFAEEAELRRVCLAPQPDWATLERLAGQTSAPSAARRARALLGDRTVALDAIDAQILDRVRGQAGWGTPSGPEVAWTPGWGLDEPTQRVWSPDGTFIELHGKPQLWRLLVVLAASGAAGLDKESLFRAVWADGDYHPLRHDNRLHATVRNLRIALGEPDVPHRVLTTPDGYCLAGPLRRWSGSTQPNV
jgi:tetratricopeptide (TPR) repeat protein